MDTVQQKVTPEPKKDTSPMSDFFARTTKPPSVKEIIEGTVASIDRGAVYVHLDPFGTGIIYGREFIAQCFSVIVR